MNSSSPARVISIAEPPYPVLMFLARYGHWLCLLFTLLVLLAGAVAVCSGFGPAWMAGAIAVAAVQYVMCRAGWELLRLLVHTLIPQ